jgi:hypothetical protein
MDTILNDHVNRGKFLGSKTLGSKTTVTTCDVGTDTEKPSPVQTVSVNPTHVKLETPSLPAIQVATASTEVAEATEATEAAGSYVTMVKTPAKHDKPVSQPRTRSDPPCPPCGTWEQSQFCKFYTCNNMKCKFVHIGNNFFMSNMTNTKLCERVQCSWDGCSFAHKTSELRDATFDLFGTVLAAGEQTGALDFDILKNADGKIYRFDEDRKLHKVN